MLIVERCVLARLRNRRFFSLAELNVAIRELRRDDQRPAHAQARRQPRRAVRDDRPAGARARCRPTPYSYAEWKRCRVAPDYHVEVDGHYYSVPSRLIREMVEARITEHHRRDLPQGQARRQPCALGRAAAGTRRSPSTCRARTGAMPNGRRPAMMREAAKIGPATVALFEAIMRAKPHPEQGFRSCLGILAARPGATASARLEAACRRGNDIGATSYGSIASILKNGLDKAFTHEPAPDGHRRSATATSAAAATTTDERRRPCMRIKGPTMLTHPTHERLIALGLTGMAKAFEDQRRQPDIAALAFEERLGLMVDREAIERENKRLATRLKFAGLRQNGRRRGHRPDERRAASTGRCSPSSSPATGSSAPEPARSSARPASARAGSPARSATRPAATTAPSSTIACRGCSRRWRSPAATAATHACSRPWRASSC